MLKRKTLALATSITLSGMFAAGPAQAGAFATSVLDITNFTIGRGGTTLDFNTDFGGRITATNTADISAILNGVTNGDSRNGVGEDIDLQPARVGNLGTPPYANNAYTTFTAPPVSSFALADQSQLGSPIANVPNPVGGFVTTPATASHAAYVSLDTAGDGSSTANNGLQADFTFALNHGGPIDLKFDARAYLEATTNASAVFPTNASSQYSLQFTIRDLAANTDIIVWKPDGSSVVGDAGHMGLTAVSDPFSLNDALSRNAPFNGQTLAAGLAPGVAHSDTWTATTVNLLADHDYQLTLRSTASADANEANVATAPEPSILALMGLGILGLGLSRCRRV